MAAPQIEHHRRPRAALPDDDEVMTIPEWCRVSGFSRTTGYRILAGPESDRPIITRLSARRVGITRGNNRRWQQQRSR